jgi:hypothetical protein
MRIENNRIKPCSTCLKVRQKAKELLDRASGKFKKYTLLECERGDLTIDNDAHAISAVSNEDWSGFVGMKVYISGQWVFDVNKAKPIGAFGPILKITKTN